ncbi:adenosine deaminase/editase [Xylaria sp. FL0933]|nr:adenosine deaminase/editase [Xylaria sp. FL0933]
MTVDPDLITSLVLKEFDKLPAKRKPVVRDNGLREWVPLSGIVAEGENGKLTCLALATGMKCLPSSKLPQAQGNVLHDWHAEILAIRSFNCFVLDECRAVASGSKSSSEFIRRRNRAEISAACKSSEAYDDGGNWHGQPFTWREDVLLHMYCSEAPCGDASMELTMASQADATPWAIPAISPEESILLPSSVTPNLASLGTDTHLPGRAYFSQLGIVRRKPSRGDAPPTLSKSCSDKLSLHQCTSLLSSPTSLLMSPEHAYISTLILPKSQYSASGCRRAFSDGQSQDEHEKENSQQQARMACLATQNNDRAQAGGYSFRPFAVKTTDLEFSFSRRSVVIIPPTPLSSPITDTEANININITIDTPLAFPKIKTTPSNLSVALTASNRQETTLNGVLQGRKASEAHVLGASFASRRKIWGLAVEVASLLPSSVNNDNSEDENTRRIQRALGVPPSSRVMMRIPTTTETKPVGAAQSPLETETEAEKEAEVEIEIEPETRIYADLKNTPLLEPRRRAKQIARSVALKGWVRNVGDDDFVL